MENKYKKFDDYGLRHLPAHLIESYCWDDITEVLCDLQFVEAKSAANMAYDLVADYNAALNGLSGEIEEPSEEERKNHIEAFGQFVREQANYFDQFGHIPGFVVQQAYNAFIDGPVARAVQPYLETLPPETCIILHHDEDRQSYNPGSPLFQVMRGHTDYVYCVALSNDGKIALSGSQDDPIHVWDVETGRCIKKLTGHEGRVKAIALSANGKTAVSASWDKTLRVWDMDNGQCLKVIPTFKDVISTMALSANGKIAITGSREGALRVWDIPTGKQIHLIETHSDYITAVTLSADGKTAVSADRNKQLKVWDVEGGILRHNIAYPSSIRIRSLSLTPDGTALVSGDDDKTVRVWDTLTGNCHQVMTGHSDAVNSVSVSANGKIAVSSSWDRTVRVWNLETGGCLKILEGHSDYPEQVVVSPDADIAVSCSDDRTVIVWNLRADLPQKPEGNIGSYTEYCAYSFDGNVKVSGKFNKTLEVWHNGGLSPKRIKTDGEINVLVLSGNGQVVMAGGWAKGLHLWNTQTDQFLGELKLECHSSLIRAAALSVDGGTAATVTSFEVLHIWDVFSNACLREIFCDVFAVVLSADGSFILTGGSDKIIRKWDTASGKCLQEFPGHTGYINFIALSPDDRLAFSVSADSTLRVWDIEAGKCIGIKGHDSEFTKVAIVNEYIKASDFFTGGVVTMELKNFSLPSPDEIKQILKNVKNIR
jgi:WD40 repeat protein